MIIKGIFNQINLFILFFILSSLFLPTMVVFNKESKHPGVVKMSAVVSGTEDNDLTYSYPYLYHLQIDNDYYYRNVN